MTTKISDDPIDLQPVELANEDKGTPPDPSETIPIEWRALLESNNVDTQEIEWWEMPSFFHTIGKQGFFLPLQVVFYLIILGVLLIFPLPVNMITIGFESGFIIPASVFAISFVIMGLGYFIALLLLVEYCSEYSYSVGSFGRYFYAISSHNFTVGFIPYTIPFLNNNIPATVVSFPYDSKYFRTDIRWNGSGSVILPYSYMTEDQRRHCVGGRGGFLYVSDVQKFLAKLHRFAAGSIDLTPKLIPYRQYYAVIHISVAVLLLVAFVVIFCVINFVNLRFAYFSSVLTFGLVVLLAAVAHTYFAYYWWFHNGVVHVNSPPNQPHDPISIFYTILTKINKNHISQ